MGVAALLAGKIDTKGRKTGIVISGGNIDEDKLKDILPDIDPMIGEINAPPGSMEAHLLQYCQKLSMEDRSICRLERKFRVAGPCLEALVIAL